jgi:membrane fusion protein, heavy metal efflux system
MNVKGSIGLISPGWQSVWMAALLVGCSAVQAGVVHVDAAQARQLGITVVEGQAVSHAALARFPAQIQIPLAQQRVVSTPAPGAVEALLVSPGQSVKAGAVVVQLRSQQVAEWQRDWQQLKAQFDLVQRTLQRDELLYAEGLIALSRLEGSRAQLEQQRVLVEERRLSIQGAGARPEGVGGELSLTSPLSGQVLEVLVTPGQRVDAVTPLLRVASAGTLWAELSVPVAQAAQLRVGDRVRGVGVVVDGTISAFAPAVQGGSQTALVRADLRGAGLKSLRAGQAIELEVQRSEAGAIQLPAAALLEDARGAAVYVQRAEGVFERRPVKVLGRSAAEGRVSVSGVQRGERVAAAGTAALKAIEATAAEGAASAASTTN